MQDTGKEWFSWLEFNLGKWGASWFKGGSHSRWLFANNGSGILLLRPHYPVHS